MTRLKLDNFFKTNTNNIVLNSTSWEIEVQLLSEPSSEFWFVVLDYENSKREEIFYHRKSWTSIFFYWINRTNPGQHEIWASVLLNDTAWIFNYISENISNLFYIYKTSTSTVKVLWWSVYSKWLTVTVPDAENPTNFTLVDWTNYLYLDTDWTINASDILPADKIVFWEIVQTVWVITSVIKNDINVFDITSILTQAQIDKLDWIEENANNYSLPIATTSILWWVKVDWTTIAVDWNWVISWVPNVVWFNWWDIWWNIVDQLDLQAALNNKVDKVVGKWLSTNDYIASDKSKVDNLPLDTITELAWKVDTVVGKWLSENDFTTALKTKLEWLESSKFLWEYASLVALQTAHPSPVAWSYAYVDAWVWQDVVKYIWDTTDSIYIAQAWESVAETPASIKTKYESNANTNAFTDAEKTKLANVTEAADTIWAVSSIDETIAIFSWTTWKQLDSQTFTIADVLNRSNHTWTQWETSLNLSDILTNNVTTTRHGFAPKLSGNSTQFLDWTGNYSVPVWIVNSYTAIDFTNETSLTINHNFWTHPVVRVIDWSGYTIIPENIQDTTLNTTVITFNPATTWTAILSVWSPQAANYKNILTDYTVVTWDEILDVSEVWVLITMLDATWLEWIKIIIDNSSIGSVFIQWHDLGWGNRQTIQWELIQELPDNSSYVLYSNWTEWRAI